MCHGQKLDFLSPYFGVNPLWDDHQELSLWGVRNYTWNYQFYMQKPQIDLYHSVFTTFSQQCQAWEHCAGCRSAAACRLEALLFPPRRGFAVSTWHRWDGEAGEVRAQGLPI